MKIFRNDKNKILIQIDTILFEIINESGQMNLKEIHKFLLETVKDKTKYLSNIDIDNSVPEELREGIKQFVTNLIVQGSLESTIVE